LVLLQEFGRVVKELRLAVELILVRKLLPMQAWLV
jgi:hypothetical protein